MSRFRHRGLHMPFGQGKSSIITLCKTLNQQKRTQGPHSNDLSLSCFDSTQNHAPTFLLRIPKCLSLLFLQPKQVQSQLHVNQLSWLTCSSLKNPGRTAAISRDHGCTLTKLLSQSLQMLVSKQQAPKKPHNICSLTGFKTTLTAKTGVTF